MPIYEYQCRKCGTFEVTQRMTDTPLRRCPECKGKVTKLLSAPSFQFKGSGWYVTDYGSKGKGSGGSESKAESSGDKSGNEKKDSDPKSKEKESPKSSTSKSTDANAA